MAMEEIENEESRAITAQLAALSPFTQELGRSVTCPICLDYIDCAQQLHCGHIFCAECVSRMLGMPKARCAICKRKTSKRMIRAAPVDFAEIVACLRELELVVQESTPKTVPQANGVVNDGFGALTGANLTSRRLSGVRQSLSPPRPVSRSLAITATRGSSRASKNTLPSFEKPGLDGCVLCPMNEVPCPENVPVDRGKLVPVTGEAERGLKVHELCGLYSAEAYEVDDVFWNVARALKNAKNMVCSRAACRGSYPTAFCAKEGCDKRYHYSCAVLDGAKCVVDGFKTFCKEHEGDAPDIDEDNFKACLEDPTGTQCLDHEDVCWQCETGGNLLICDSCPRVVHPACAGLKSLPIGDYYCANCTAEISPTPEDSECTPNGTPETERPETGKGAKRKFAGRRSSTGRSKTGTKRARRSSIIMNRGSQEQIWRPVLCSTGLDEAQKVLLKGVAGIKRTPVRREFDRKVTHMIINAFVPENSPTRTMKLCKAIAAGVVLVCFKWIEDSMELDVWADVNQYIHPWTRNLSIHGPLFGNSRFYFGALRGVNPQKEELSAIVKLGGGTILNREPTVDMAPSTDKLYIIQDVAKIRQGGRRNSYAWLADSIPGAEVVDQSWILDRCAASNQQAGSNSQ